MVMAVAVDVLSGWLAWSVLVQWIATSWYFSLAALGPTGWVAVYPFLFLPCAAVGSERVKRLCAEHAPLLFAFGLVPLVAAFSHSTPLQMVTLTLALVPVWTCVFAQLLSALPDRHHHHQQQQQQGLDTLLLSFVVFGASRFANGSLDPLFAVGWFRTLFMVVYSLLVAAVELTPPPPPPPQPAAAAAAADSREEDDDDTEELAQQARPRLVEGSTAELGQSSSAAVLYEESPLAMVCFSTLYGVGFGCSLFLLLMLFGGHGVVMRWSGFNPHPAGVAVLIALLLGCVWARAARARFMRLRTALFCVCAVVFAWSDRVGPLRAIAGVLMAAVTPSVVVITHGLAVSESRVPRPRLTALCVALVLMIGIVASVATAGWGYLPGGRALEKNGGATFVLAATLGVAVATTPAILSGVKRERWASSWSYVGGERRSWWRYVAVALVVLVCVVVRVAVFEQPKVEHGAVPPRRKFSIVTYNVQQGYREDGPVNFADVEAWIGGADVVCLQETDTARLHNGNRDIVEWLAGRKGFPYQDYGLLTSQGTWGVALLSKWPLRDRVASILPSTDEYGVMLEATVADLNVTVFCAHFSLTEHEKREQALAVRARVRSGQRAVVLAGDWNSEPGTEPYVTLSELGANAYAATHNGRLPETTHVPPFEVIDHIFVSEEMRVLSADVLTQAGRTSDHYPVTAVVERTT